jgi:urease accessory protein
MEKHTTHTKSLSRFIQILDSSFPSGAFVHSFGLEPHVVLQKITSIEDLTIFLHNMVCDQYMKLEFVIAQKVYVSLQTHHLNSLLILDKKYRAMLTHEWAKAMENLGANYLKHLDTHIQHPTIQAYFNLVREKKAIGNEMIILSCYAYELSLDIHTFLTLWCKKNLINIATAALKISRIKPSEIQQMLFEFDEFIEAYILKKDAHINNFNPLFEEVIFQHKNLEPKLFVT